MICWLFHWPFWFKLLGAWERPALADHQIGWWCQGCCKSRGLMLYALLFPYRTQPLEPKD